MFYFCVLIFLMFYKGVKAHDGVVRLDCHDKSSCFGVALNWNLMLTTSSCARSCSSINHNGAKLHIERTLYHPQGRNTRHNKSPRKLAIIQVEEGISRGFVRLLSIDIELIEGTPVIFSTAAKSVTFREKIVKYCIFELKRSGRAYICTRGDTRENCSLEGLPLFKDKRVIALSEKQKVCNIQRAFISVGSFIPWVNSVLKYKKTKVIHNRTSDYLTTSHIIQSSKGLRKQTRHVTNPKTMFSKSAVLKPRPAKEASFIRTVRISARNSKSCSRNIETLLKSINNKSRIWKPKLTVPKPLRTKSIVLPVILSTPSKGGYINKRVPPKRKAVPQQNPPTRITIEPSPMSTSRNISKIDSHIEYFMSRESGTKSNTCDLNTNSELFKLNGSIDSIESNMSPFYDKTTNALDWFKKRLDERLKGPPPVLVLTTGDITKEFVDLT